MQRSQFLKYIHPFFFGLYTIFSVLGTINGFKFADIFRSLSLIIIITGILLYLGWKFNKINKVAIALSFFYLWFYCYNLIYFFVYKPIPLVSYGLPILYFSVFAIGIILVIKTKRNLEMLNKILSVISIFLICLGIFPILVNSIIIQENPPLQKNANIDDNNCYYSIIPSNKPDIYIILLDQYAGIEGQKTLLINNTQNFDRFQTHGFKTLDYYSNYDLSKYSIKSFFDMKYLPEDYNNDTKYDRSYDFKNSKILRILKNYNYSTVYLDSGIWYLDNSWEPDFEYNPSLFNAFEETLLSRSYIYIPLTVYDKRERMNSIITTLPSLVELPEPKFVYVYVNSPHQPYILNKDGTISSSLFSAAYYDKNAYIQELEGTSVYAENIVSIILKESKNEPIIIVLSDHGHRLPIDDWKDMIIPNRFSALFAYYLPSYLDDPFYENMTAVNVFRTLFHSTFGANCTRLQDQIIM